MITVIGNLKGGSGKSTVIFNLALWLLHTEKSVLAYDFDPQCTLSDATEVRKDEKFDPALKVYTRFQANKTAEDYDEILIDVGTANMAALKRAIKMADRIVIPVSPSQADVWSTQRFLYIISSEVANDRKPPEVYAFVNRADTHAGVRESDQTEEALDTLPGVKVLKTRLCQRTVYRRSFSEGLAVFELEPSGKGANEFEIFAQTIYPKS